MSTSEALVFEAIIERVRQRFAERYIAREQSLQLAREVIRHAANAIRASHRQEIDRADDLLGRAADLLAQIRTILAAYPDIFYAGFVQDAEKEYVEAAVTLAIIADRPWPTPEALAVGDVAYLNGIGEAVGEIRRYLLDLLRRGRLERTEALLAAMDDIYAALVTIDYPDGFTGGLRRTTDMVRGVLEKTRGDLTMAWRQQVLAEQMEHLARRLSESSA